MNKDLRTIERLRHHFEVEKSLAARLLASTRAERPQLFRTMYGELFAQVPDHPRLIRREQVASSQQSVASQMTLLRGQLAGVKSFLEFAPGDCRLAFEVCRHVDKVFAVDISDQSGEARATPGNFELIVYDGYQLAVRDQSIDLIFSYQFIEHLHPDDVRLHFQLVKRLLKPGGAYIFSTPHRFSGPHDISGVFSDTPQGFHMKEWTFREMGELLHEVGFSAWFAYRFDRPRTSGIINRLNLTAESVVGTLPVKLRRALSGRLFEGVTMLVRA